MSKADAFVMLHGLAVRPDLLHWVIFYTSPQLAGLHAATIWSSNRRDIVQQEFLHDYHPLRPRIEWMDFIEGENVKVNRGLK